MTSPLRLSRRLLAGFAALALLGPAAAADAQETTTSTTSSTVPAESTTTTAPPAEQPPPPPPPAPPVEQAPPPPADEEAHGDDAESANDVPTEQVVVPPPTEPLPENPVAELVQEFVGVGLREARRQLSAAEQQRFAVMGQVQGIEASVAALEADLARLQGEQAAAVARLQEARAQLRRRAVASYMGVGTAPAESLLDVKDINEFGRWLQFARAVIDADRDRVDEYTAARQQVTDDVERTVSRLDEQRAALLSAQATLMGVDATVVAKQVQASSAAAGGTAAAAGFTFPVGQPYSYSDTFGAPRMFGTPFAHLHQGTDIFAPMGTPLLACERGVLTKVGTDRLGGTKLWIIGASGTRYYYAHLSAFAPGVQDGLIVNPGDLIGFVGKTGNAATTPAHLHFEVHPNGGPAINPYPLLRAFDDATSTLGRKPAGR